MGMGVGVRVWGGEEWVKRWKIRAKRGGER